MDAQILAGSGVALGARLLRERETSEKSLDRVAAELAVSVETIEGFENGTVVPSLPQLELLARLYRVPLESLTGKTPDGEALPTLEPGKTSVFMILRTRIIALTLKQARLKKELAPKQLAEQTGIPLDQFEKYEAGTEQIPEPELEKLCEILDIKMDSLFSPLTPKIAENNEPATTEIPPVLPEDLQEFVTNPTNLPYLELAKKLSEMDAARLRTIAESLLEITY